jgi:hypothetical protein
LSEALSRFPGQEELSFALAESLNATAQPQQALDVLALVPASLAAAKDFVAVAARARAMLSGEAPSVEIEARLIEAHEKGYQEWLDENSRRVVELYPLWARGHAIYAAALCAVAGRRARPENFEVSSDWGVPQVHAHWRKQLAVSAARQRDEAACQVSEALKLDPADAVARHVATRVAFEVTGAVHEQDRPLLEAMAGGAGSSLGRGGMSTKILAARRAAGSGASTVIAWGREPDALLRLARGEAIGTLLVAQTQKKQARKRWMVDHLQLRGSVTVDAGAAAKLRGHFIEGDRVTGFGEADRCRKPRPSAADDGDLHAVQFVFIAIRAVPRLPAVWPTMPAPRRVGCAASHPRSSSACWVMRPSPKWCTATTWWCLRPDQRPAAAPP